MRGYLLSHLPPIPGLKSHSFPGCLHLPMPSWEGSARLQHPSAHHQLGVLHGTEPWVGLTTTFSFPSLFSYMI